MVRRRQMRRGSEDPQADHTGFPGAEMQGARTR